MENKIFYCVTKEKLAWPFTYAMCIVFLWRRPQKLLGTFYAFYASSATTTIPPSFLHNLKMLKVKSLKAIQTCHQSIQACLTSNEENYSVSNKPRNKQTSKQ